MARVTGLEPATSGVTGRHSNQLSYTRVCLGAAPIWPLPRPVNRRLRYARDLTARASLRPWSACRARTGNRPEDRKSTRLELQSLMRISYAVFCLKKKKKRDRQIKTQQ